MLRYFLIIFLVFCPYALVAQLVGSVRNADGERLSHVHAYLHGLSSGAVTDELGRFELAVPNRDSVTLRFTCVGFTARDIKILLPHHDSLIVYLTPSRVQLQEVTVISANRIETPADAILSSVTSITHQQLERLLPRTTPEALMGSAGVWVQKTNHGGGSPIIRGLVGNQILALIDGIRLNNSTYRYGPNQYLNTVDVGSLERIEVMRGGGSVLYGSDALGGSVQLLTVTPSFSVGRTLNSSGHLEGKWMSAGMEKTGRGAINLSNQRFAFRAGASARDFGQLTAGPLVGTLEPTAYQEKAWDAKALVRITPAGLLTATYQQVFQRHVPRYDQVALGGYQQFEFEPQERELAYLRWESTGPGQLLSAIRLTGIFQRAHEKVVAQRTGSTREKINHDKVSTWGATAEVTSQFSTHWQAQTGLDFYQDQVSSSAIERNLQTQEEVPVRGSFSDGARMMSAAIFTYHQFTWPRVSINAGARYNMVEVAVSDPLFGNQAIEPSAVVFNASSRFAVTRQLRVVASVNSGFRAPNVDDISRFGPVEATVYEIPSGQLKPERALNTEFGLQWTSSLWSVRSVAYYNQLTDLIDRRPTTYQGVAQIDGRQVYQKQNVGEAYIWGWETDGEWRVTDFFSTGGNLTYTFGQNETTGEPLRRIPPLFGSWFGQIRGKKLWTRLEWQAAGNQDRLAKGDLHDVRISSRLSPENIFPGWDAWNVYFGYHLDSFEFQIGLQNLLNASYRVYASGVDGYGLSFWISGRWRW